MAVQQIGDLRVESPQAPSVRQAALQGRSFLIATGGAVPAQSPMTLTLANLPHHSTTPLYVALVLAGVTVAAGVWLASRVPVGETLDQRTRTLQTRRERGLAALAAVEADHQAGRVDGISYERRRTALVQDLERVYAELDARGALGDGDPGLAA
jgi:hypothetical protein